MYSHNDGDIIPAFSNDNSSGKLCGEIYRKKILIVKVKRSSFIKNDGFSSIISFEYFWLSIKKVFMADEIFINFPPYYFPTQKFKNIVLRISSGVVLPSISSSARSAPLKYSATISYSFIFSFFISLSSFTHSSRDL